MYVDNPEKLVADLIQEAQQPTFGDEFEEPYDIEEAVQDMAHDYATELYQRTTEAVVGFAERSLYMLGLLRKTLDPIVGAGKLDPYLANVFIYAAVGTLYDMVQSDICNESALADMESEDSVSVKLDPDNPDKWIVTHNVD